MQLRTAKSSDRYHSGDRRLAALVLALMLLASLVVPAAAQQENFPRSIELPFGFRPEGISIAYGTTFYVGSIPTGDVYSGDLRTGEGAILVDAPAGRAAIGLKVDERSGLLFVAGGPTGMGFVYDARTGAEVAAFEFETTVAPFINDVVITRDAAYFTNSREAVLYRVALGARGQPTGDVETLALTGDWVQPAPGSNGANGIVATPGDKWLIVMNSTQQQLYRVDPDTGEAVLIDLGGAVLPNGDGLWLQGHRLWVVQNRINQVSVIELKQDYAAGEVVDFITDALFRVPTTIAPFGRWFYAVNARFGAANPDSIDYDIVRFDQR